jgi:hypothetical protein
MDCAIMSLTTWLMKFAARSRRYKERRHSNLSFELLEDRQLLSVGHTTSFFRSEDASSPIVDYVLPDTRALDVNRAYDALTRLGGDTLAYGLWTEEERSPQSWSDFRSAVARLQAERPELEVLAYVGSPAYAGSGTFTWVAGDPSDDVGRYTDYVRWSREVAQLGREFPIVTGILLDDFSTDMQRDAGLNKVFSPEYVTAIRDAGQSILPEFRVEAVEYLSAISAYDAQRFEGRLDAVHFFYRHVDGQRTDADPDRIAGEIEMFQRAYSVSTLSPLATIYRPSNQRAQAGDVVTVEATLDLDAISTDLVVAHFDTVPSSAASRGWVQKTILFDGKVIYDADLADDSVGVHTITIPAAQIAALRASGRRTAELTMSLTITQSYTRWSYAANVFVRQPDDVYLDWTWSDPRGSNVVVSSRDLVAPPERFVGLYGGSPSFMDVTPEYTQIVLDHARAAYAAGDVEGINVWEVMMQDTNSTDFTAYKDFFAAAAFDRDRGLFTTGSYAFNWGGAEEKWIRGKDATWYYILPTGDVFEWAGTGLDGQWVATFDPSYYVDPQRLYAAAPDERLANLTLPNRATVAAYFDEKLGLQAADKVYENWGGRGEKWLLGRKREWYFILPDGSLYAWDRQPTATGGLVARLSPDYHADLQLLYDAHAYAIDSIYGLDAVDDRWTDWGGMGEKWINSGGSWYYLHADGALFLFRDKTAKGLVGIQVATVDRSYYTDPNRLSRAQATHLATFLGLHRDGELTPYNGVTQEKWFLDRDLHWLFLTPNGSLHRWNGGPTAAGPRLAVLDSADYADLSWLPSPVESR